MATEMGEYLVGAYLNLVLKCGVVDYNARPPGGGLPGLGELDVIGFNFDKRTAYLCEVTTHLDGLLIGKDADSTLTKLVAKHCRQQQYAARYLKDFTPRYMFWSPVVRSGLVEELKTGTGFELFINETYSEAISGLRKMAKNSTADVNNPAFRVLQILEHMRFGLKAPERVDLGVAASNQISRRERPEQSYGKDQPNNTCPECGHHFKGNGFDGIDAHWRAKHNDVMTYEEAWPLIKSGSYTRKAGSY